MMRSIQSLLCFLSVIIFFASCNKDELDAIYGRPDNLGAPIYQQLQERGNFKSMLAVIDKAGYKDILGKAGYWTLFAPNDEAFQVFLKERNLSSVDGLDKETAATIVRYSTLYNAYRKDNISTYESPERVLEPGKSFRKKSTYYDYVYELNGKKYLACNTNFLGYYLNDNNNKYVPIFTSQFFNTSGVSLNDYNSLFPGVAFSDFNVADASVKTADIVAENGIIHEIDKVIMPLKSIEQYLSSNPEYSEFKKLLDSNAFYFGDYRIQLRYKAVTGSSDTVLIKFYGGGLAFSPNNENYLSTGSSDAQSDAFTIAVPTNAQLLAYKETLLKDWEGKQLTASMRMNLINSHMWTRSMWPSKLNVTPNSLGEKATFATSNVLEKKLLSNGIFYGINKVQEANVFRTVYSKPYLNSRYQLQTRGLNRAIAKEITDPTLSFGLIMQSDDQFLNVGYSFSELNANYSWKNPATGATIINDVARDRFLRILNTTVFDNSFLNLSDFSGEGVLKGSKGEGEVEEYLYYNNNKLYAAGNLDSNTPVTVEKIENTVNGPVFYTSGTLLFSEKKIGTKIKELATSDPASYKHFYDFLRQSTLVWKSDESLEGVVLGTEYTVLVPTNQAIEAAVKRGDLPGNTSTGVPSTNPSSVTDKEKVAQFLLYHIIEKETVAPDGDPDKQDRMTTLFKDPDASEPDSYIYVTNQLKAMKILDATGNTANLIWTGSNKLADRALIHSIDRVLKAK